MISAILRLLGYVRIDYGFSCGRYWVEIDGKIIAQTAGDDLWMADGDVRRLAQGIWGDACVWGADVDDEWYVQHIKRRWPWHDLGELRAAKMGSISPRVYSAIERGAIWRLPESLQSVAEQNVKNRRTK